MVVRESIEFKRGLEPKKALNLGFEGLIPIFRKILNFNDQSVNEICFWSYGGYDGNTDYIEINYDLISKKHHINAAQVSRTNNFMANILGGYAVPENISSQAGKVAMDVLPSQKEIFKRFVKTFGEWRSGVYSLKRSDLWEIPQDI